MRRDSSSFMPLSTLPPFPLLHSFIYSSLFLVSPGLSLRQAISTWKQCPPRGYVGYKGTYTTYFESRRNNVSPLVGQMIGRLSTACPGFRGPGLPASLSSSQKPRRSVIYPKWSTVSNTKSSDKEDEIYIR